MIPAFHHVPGRLRILLPELKRNAIAAELLREEIAKLDGVVSVSANVISGNVIVHYDRTRADAAAVVAFLQRRGYQVPKTGEFAASARREPAAPGIHDHVAHAALNALFDWLIGRTAASLLRAMI